MTDTLQGTAGAPLPVAEIDPVRLSRLGVLGERRPQATDSGIESFAGVHAINVHG
jgi:hypothetical protein